MYLLKSRQISSGLGYTMNTISDTYVWLDILLYSRPAYTYIHVLVPTNEERVRFNYNARTMFNSKQQTLTKCQTVYSIVNL